MFTNMCVVIIMLNSMCLGVVIIALFIFFIVCIWLTFKYHSNKAKKKHNKSHKLNIRVPSWVSWHIYFCIDKFSKPKNVLYQFSTIKCKEK